MSDLNPMGMLGIFLIIGGLLTLLTPLIVRVARKKRVRLIVQDHGRPVRRPEITWKLDGRTVATARTSGGRVRVDTGILDKDFDAGSPEEATRQIIQRIGATKTDGRVHLPGAGRSVTIRIKMEHSTWRTLMDRLPSG
jgi:hypothetical protein